MPEQAFFVLLRDCSGWSEQRRVRFWWLFFFWSTGPRVRAQRLWHTVLVVSGHVGASWARDQVRIPCIGRRILYCWATREVQDTDVLKGVSCVTAHLIDYSIVQT